MIILPFPAKILWPNGRGHHMTKHREFQKHKEWARLATLSALPRCFKWNGEPIKIRYTITPKAKTSRTIDKDNAIAAMKAYQDGIAAALGFDDSLFETPEIAFQRPLGPGGVEVTL